MWMRGRADCRRVLHIGQAKNKPSYRERQKTANEAASEDVLWAWRHPAPDCTFGAPRSLALVTVTWAGSTPTPGSNAPPPPPPFAQKRHAFSAINRHLGQRVLDLCLTGSFWVISEGSVSRFPPQTFIEFDWHEKCDLFNRASYEMIRITSESGVEIFSDFQSQILSVNKVSWMNNPQGRVRPFELNINPHTWKLNNLTSVRIFCFWKCIHQCNENFFAGNNSTTKLHAVW